MPAPSSERCAQIFRPCARRNARIDRSNPARRCDDRKERTASKRLCRSGSTSRLPDLRRCICSATGYFAAGLIFPCSRSISDLATTMSAPPITPQTRTRKINLRTPDVMAKVQEQVQSHYRSVVVERIHANGGTLTVRDTTVRLAKQFGFCYGVERAIDLAYAARKVFADSRLYMLGEIIH